MENVFPILEALPFLLCFTPPKREVYLWLGEKKKKASRTHMSQLRLAKQQLTPHCLEGRSEDKPVYSVGAQCG